MKRVSLRRAFDDKSLLGSVLAGDFWLPWRAILLASMGETLHDDERIAFQSLTQRPAEPGERVEELWAIVGRRGGKSRAAATLGVYLSALCDHRSRLAVGERGIVLLMAQTKEQAQVAFDYCAGIFDSVPMLAALVVGRTSDTITLSNGIDLQIRAASFRGLRGVTCVAVIADEVAFWATDAGSANADVEILNAVRPALATTGGPLIAISSPYAARGALYEAHRQHYGPSGDAKILVAQGASRDFNPSLPQSVVDRATARDLASASAEYLGQFRRDLENFIDRALVESAVDRGVLVRSTVPGVQYFAFADPSGGSHDAFTLGIAHREADAVILDCLIERRPPFNAQEVVREMAATLREFGLSACVGDRYAGSWVQQAFASNGISYAHSGRDRSQVYVDALPLFSSGRARLLDNPRIVNQIAALERRTGIGRDRIDHPQHGGGADDAANSACGALVLAADRRADVPMTGPLMFSEIASLGQPSSPANGDIARSRDIHSMPGALVAPHAEPWREDGVGSRYGTDWQRGDLNGR